ncbi:MAG: RES family NAD+ phosphorylase, partial [Bradyrhizobium sp.]|nr:RES family NAD+ phosphorylase [Bradyrhizobium sp.]
DGVTVDSIGNDALVSDWRTQPALTRLIGDQWLDQSASALLQVPSVIVPIGKNFLLNPAHPDAAKVTIAAVVNAPFDPRLLPGS